MNSESLRRSRRTDDQDPRCFIGYNISGVKNSVNDVTSLLEETDKVSEKTIQMYSRTTVSSKVSNEDRLVLVALGKAENQRWHGFQDQKNEPGSLPNV